MSTCMQKMRKITQLRSRSNSHGLELEMQLWLRSSSNGHGLDLDLMAMD